VIASKKCRVLKRPGDTPKSGIQAYCSTLGFSRSFASDFPGFRDCRRPAWSVIQGRANGLEIDAELDLQQPVLSRTNHQAEPATFLPRVRANREVDLIFKRDLHCVNPK
jgi:hypothetical protein